jgi:hypothetical protein
MPQRRDTSARGQPRRFSGPLHLCDERAKLAILPVEVEVRPFAAGDQLFGGRVPLAEHLPDGLVAGSVLLTTR